MSIQLTGLSRYQALYNGRVKTYPDGSRQMLVCDRPVFNPEGLESTAERTAGRKKSKAGESGERRSRRAIAKVKDYILCNPFRYFITLTLDGDKVSRTDYRAVIPKLNKWLDNAVQRKGLQYILVPEHHKDGQAIHFHGCINNRLPLVDSGTVSVEGIKKPVRISTYNRHYRGRDYHTVYNIPSWGYGFTTAIELYGERIAAARYVAKYLEKDFTKIGGRYYLHSSNLRQPQVDYVDIDYEHFEGAEFTIPGAPSRWKALTIYQ